MTAGRLNKRIRLERRSAISGGAGGDRFGRSGGEWIPAFGPAEATLEQRQAASERWAGPSPKTGSETLSGRLEGRQAWEFLVRSDPETVTLTIADRVVVLNGDRSGGLFLNIKAVAPLPVDQEAFLILTCEAGGPNG